MWNRSTDGTAVGGIPCPRHNLFICTVVDDQCIASKDEKQICTCDLGDETCDVNCCCDPDCSDDDRLAFSGCTDRRVWVCYWTLLFIYLFTYLFTPAIFSQTWLECLFLVLVLGLECLVLVLVLDLEGQVLVNITAPDPAGKLRDPPLHQLIDFTVWYIQIWWQHEMRLSDGDISIVFSLHCGSS